MSHKEMRIYLPSGDDVALQILEEMFPQWFTQNQMNHIETFISNDCRRWGMRSNDLQILRTWCENMIRHYGRDRQYWLTVCIVGVARKHNLDPLALIEIFEEVHETFRAIFDKSIKLPYRTPKALV